MRLLKKNERIDVSFGIVNCNRLFYLRSCLESLLETTKDFDNMEVVIVDNASIEKGTEDYLRLCEEHGVRVFRMPHRDPNNEFARGLNTIVRETTGWLVCPLQGDMQFVLPNWLPDYVNFACRYSNLIGSIAIDAQRRTTVLSHNTVKTINSKFYVDNSRDVVAGAADCMYVRDVLTMVGKWNENNKQHEGGGDSETDYLIRVKRLRETESKIRCLRSIVPAISPAIAIFTDSRGTNARVRGDKRYGDYWEPKQDAWRYYELRHDLVNADTDELQRPMSIEEMAVPIGFNAPIDENGNWMKNPINPTYATISDYVVLSEVSFE
jgi:hypothetical protein